MMASVPRPSGEAQRIEAGEVGSEELDAGKEFAGDGGRCGGRRSP